MSERDWFAYVFFWVMTVVLVGQFVLNFWAWRIQRRIEKRTPPPVPLALRDREEVTFWQTVSSALMAALGLRVVFGVSVESHLILIVFGIALSVKTIPSARWLWRYYRNGFSEG